MTYRILDLFCGAGGAAMGYYRAGFEVVGVDINPQPRYPFEFVQANALTVLMALATNNTYAGYARADFDAIHTSPPCQHYSIMSACVPGTREKYPDLVGPVREPLQQTGLPFVIENVVGAPLNNPVVLCGTSFGLDVWRHRLFEASFPIPELACAHNGHVMNPHNAAGRKRMYEKYGPGDPEKRWAAEMGVEWMNRREARESIPPAYTEYVGRQLTQYLNSTSNQAA